MKVLSNDEGVNAFFEQVIRALEFEFSHDTAEARRIAFDYYRKFTDENYCRSIGIPVQSQDFFFHESAVGMALRIHYHLTLRGDPNPHSYIDWRANHLRASKVMA